MHQYLEPSSPVGSFWHILTLIFFVRLLLCRYTTFTFVHELRTHHQVHTGQLFCLLMSLKRGKGSHNYHLSFPFTPFLNLLSLHSIRLPSSPPPPASLTPPILPGYLALPNGGCGGWWVGSGPGLPDNCKQLGKLVAPASPSGGLLVYNLIGLHVKTVKAWEKQDASVRWNSNCQPAQNIRTVCLIACNQRGKSRMEGGAVGNGAALEKMNLY